MVEFEPLHDSVSLLLADVQLQSFLAFVVGDKVVFEGQDLVCQDRVINPLLVIDGPRVEVGLVYSLICPSSNLICAALELLHNAPASHLYLLFQVLRFLDVRKEKH